MLTCALMLMSLSTPALIPEDPTNTELAGYLAEAGQLHPALEEQYAAWQASLQRIPQVTALEDPKVSYGQFLQSDTFRFRAMLSQHLPWRGVRKTKGEKAALDAETAFNRLASERNRIFLEVKQAYYDLTLLKHRLEVTEAQLAVILYTEDIVLSKLALGMATDDEALRVSIMKTQTEDAIQQLKALRPALTTRLNTAIGSDPELERPWPMLQSHPTDLPDSDTVKATILDNNPDLKIFDAMMLAWDKQQEVAAQRKRPGVTVGLEYTDVKGPVSGLDDNLAVNVSITIPIWQKKIRAGIEEARWRGLAAKHAKKNHQRSLDEILATTLFELQDSKRRYELYEKQLLPQARQSYESLRGSYAADYANKGLLDVLESLQTVLDFELEQYRALRDWQFAQAQLAYLQGSGTVNPTSATVR